MAHTESFQFQAETSQLLKLVIGSLYTHKDIFLRELISNASDALDRLRFESLTATDLVPEGHPFEIRLEVDPGAHTLTVHDSGIGMSRDEVIANIGTIAKSGTRELLQEAAQSGGAELASKLIGQFGVGFYSAFMVADQVSLLTRRAGEEGATLWESSGEGRFDVADARRDGCGTSVTLHLLAKDEDAGIRDFADPRVLEGIVKRYSDFITHPIICAMERTEYDRDEDGTVKEGAEPRKVVEDRRLNAMKPIWTRAANEVSEEEYAEFYRHIAHDWTEPLKTISLKAEGRLEYRALLFIPAQAPFDLAFDAHTWGLQLYAKQVMIMERCEELLPPWLRFVKGIVDSADLPLNVSRETLQQDRHIVQIRKWLTGRVLRDLGSMARDDAESYGKFWRHFGRILKEGASADGEHSERLTTLLRFPSSHDTEAVTSLADYRARMKPEQDEIFYLTGESRAMVEASPHLEAFAERGYEVLYLTDPVDELVVQAVTEYDGKALKSAAKGALDLGTESEREETKKGLEEKAEALGDLLGRLQEHLKDHVKEVRLSARLVASPACLVGSEQDLSPHLERMLRHSQYEVPRQLRILELNPGHPVVEKLQQRFASDADDAMIADAADLLLGYAFLAEGSELPDTTRFNTLLADFLGRAL